MTSLGRLVFTDTHSRQTESVFPDSSQNSSECLSLAFEHLFFMPHDIVANYGSTIHTLDISHNNFGRNLHFLAEFENLTTLNLDNNNIDSLTVFPYMPKLQLLWINNNRIENLFPFIKNLSKSMPNLQYLSLMGNTAAPSYMTNGTFYDYLQYRFFVISWFPALEHLDDRVITPEQRAEAKRLFKRPFLEQLIERAPLPNCIKFMHSKLTAVLTKPVILQQNAKPSRAPNLVI
ncbi:hypothetical protein QAD02_011869 [Eretmocerus hayati]|uniref:Uncharacterized protein n=1 Tax=Eretmocerus hayati TaxID=131215 RepID=A0ACC2NZ00_9HYME|nr:hypothetical protein QAD02_011869 [Eretmocerus hayati]